MARTPTTEPTGNGADDQDSVFENRCPGADRRGLAVPQRGRPARRRGKACAQAVPDVFRLPARSRQGARIAELAVALVRHPGAHHFLWRILPERAEVAADAELERLDVGELARQVIVLLFRIE